jgi:hypothetical protein
MKIAMRTRWCPVLLVAAVIALSGCWSPWTARVCEARDGNCRATDIADKHQYTLSSKNIGPLSGLTDVQAKDQSCSNGIGAVDVDVHDRDKLTVTIYCLNDHSTPGSPPRLTLDPGASSDAGLGTDGGR